MHSACDGHLQLPLWKTCYDLKTEVAATLTNQPIDARKNWNRCSNSKKMIHIKPCLLLSFLNFKQHHQNLDISHPSAENSLKEFQFILPLESNPGTQVPAAAASSRNAGISAACSAVPCPCWKKRITQKFWQINICLSRIWFSKNARLHNDARRYSMFWPLYLSMAKAVVPFLLNILSSPEFELIIGFQPWRSQTG